jgi:hypothetical protein
MKIFANYSIIYTEEFIAVICISNSQNMSWPLLKPQRRFLLFAEALGHEQTFSEITIPAVSILFAL